VASLLPTVAKQYFMKPNTFLKKKRNIVLPIAAAIFGAAIFTACTKEPSFETTTETADASSSDDVVSAARTSTYLSARAGADQTIALPTTSVTLSGSAVGGTPRSWRWSKQVGGAATITSPSKASTTVTGLAAGEYRFNLRVTDNSGNTSDDTLHVSVTGGTARVNQAPTVNAGSAQTITLPTSSVTLLGSAADADGSIASYQWSKTSGGTATIASAATASTSVTGLTAGTYVFSLKVTDNEGATANSSVTVTVNNSTTTTAPATSGSYGTVIYSTGYNAVADLDPWGSGQWGSGTLASHLSTTIYKDGPGCFKSDPSSVSAGYRSEVQYPDNLTPLEGAIEYDVMYQTVFQNSGHSLQFHPQTTGGSASPGLWHIDGKFVWTNWKNGTNTYYPTNFTIPAGKWMHIVFEYKIGSTGYMKMTIDGVVVLNKTGIQVGDGSGQYLKVGVNMWQTQSSVVYYDNLKIWKK
jgi:hypothetical protein